MLLNNGPESRLAARQFSCHRSTGAPKFPPIGIDSKTLAKIQQDLQTYCNLIQPPYFPLPVSRNSKSAR